MKTIKYRRISEIKLTNEARLLKQLRIQSGLSIREVGRRLGRSECFVRHIEKGRLDVPKKEILRIILSLYGVSYMQFKKRLEGNLKFKKRDECIQIINSLNNHGIEIAFKILKQLL